MFVFRRSVVGSPTGLLRPQREETMRSSATYLLPTLALFVLLGVPAFPPRAQAQANPPQGPATTAQPAIKIETVGGRKTEESATSKKAEDLPSSRVRSASEIELLKRLGKFSIPGTIASDDIGIVPGVNGCPSGSEAITIYMDDEDNANANSQTGWIGAIIQDQNTTFKFCRVNGTQFVPASAGVYAVLQLDNNCPNNSFTVVRYFDNEDNSNQNYFHTSAGYGIHPNSQSSVPASFTSLSFCIFLPSSAPSPGFPDLGIEYGVFASSDLTGALAVGSLYIDDEDAANNNHYIGGTQNYVSNIIFGDKNTTMRIAKVRPPRVCAGPFSINGHFGTSVTTPFPNHPIVLDASCTPSNSGYFVAIQLSDLWWNRYGPEAGRWLTAADILHYGPLNHFDIKQFAQDQWFTFVSGQYYRVKLAVGPVWAEYSALVYVQ